MTRAPMLFCAALLLLATCGRERNPMQPSFSVPVRDLVTPDIANQLDVHGRFVLSPPHAPDDRPIISPARATELAIAFLRTWGESHQAIWEQQRGEPISIGLLRPSPRVLYAQTPHGRFPDGPHSAYQRIYGPWYLVYFESGGTPVLGVAVSAYSTDLEVRNGLIQEPYAGGSYFMTHAVTAPGHGSIPFVPVSPERAAEFVAKHGAARVNGVPALILRAGWHPLQSLWQVTLDRDVSATRLANGRTSAPGERRSVREVFVGTGPEVFIRANGAQPSLRVHVPIGDIARPSSISTIDLPVRDHLPLQFDEVSLSDEVRQ